MPLQDASAYQTLIVIQLGDIKTTDYPEGVLAANIETLWMLNDGQPTDELRYLYTKRSAIETLQGVVKEQVSLSGNNMTMQLSDKARNLQVMLTNTTNAIERTEEKGKEAAQQRGRNNAPAAGQLTTTAPIAAPTGCIDGNDTRYRGDLYRR